ncbi:proline iminopeptidase [Amycolatopsis bartoniae]|uniref:Proline iminopeptidase n=1 Tax=Amycolatopsis bartoniae TaxID=941986 RepID=A0A8H9ISI5_9PSEU|nr:prolyl aminopeptidase [Amycolatopsis bartoniae]MBB2934677.1 proline iminopeptidase [Amycolatopsis bartoniae]TVT09334.1 prolyl aminopeptidase [Amycolatopsis bartoniae]GHF45599.1 proline iminopeptidase [Amycolatopsis bartoniae]
MRYPPIEPYDSGMLDVGDGHSLYWETCGNADGKPALVLHGGPGSGCSARQRGLFDPGRYRIVLFDQRNAGRSVPSAAAPFVDLSANTTQHLIADIERLRVHLGVPEWLVWGGSWGVTLALAYAQAHPERVTELVLAAVTSGDRRETDWITRDMGRVFPREWERFRALVPDDDDLAAGYSRLLHDPDPEVRAEAARSWCDWEDTHISLAPGAAPYLSVADPAFQLAFARIVTHYWSQGCFLEEGQLLRDIGRLAGIPGVLIHGRYDVSGPLDTAWALHKAWPGSELVVLDDAGHGGTSMTEAIVEATDRFARPTHNRFANQ